MNSLKRIFLSIATLLAVALSCFAQNTTKYTTANLNLRNAGNTKSKVLTVISKGTSVIIAEDCDCKWILVSYNGHIGYVSSKYLSKQKPATQTAKSVYPTSSVKYYTNVDGYRVQSPTHYNSAPASATALCRDGTYSFSRNRRGTCSHHGGVAKWLK